VVAEGRAKVTREWSIQAIGFIDERWGRGDDRMDAILRRKGVGRLVFMVQESSQWCGLARWRTMACKTAAATLCWRKGKVELAAGLHD
jgi:hypothetical protein